MIETIINLLKEAKEAVELDDQHRAHTLIATAIAALSEMTEAKQYPRRSRSCHIRRVPPAYLPLRLLGRWWPRRRGADFFAIVLEVNEVSPGVVLPPIVTVHDVDNRGLPIMADAAKGEGHAA
jgi:hypothetical protein